MTMNIDIKEQYLETFEKFVKSLPKDAIKINNKFENEINKRVNEYYSGQMETITHTDMWNSI